MASVQVAVYTDYGNDIYVRANDALQVIDYNAIEAACDDIVNLSKTECESISKKVKNVHCGQDILSVKDKTMEPLIEEVGDLIATIPTYIENTIAEVKNRAETIYIQEQTRLNNDALRRFQAMREAKNNAKYQADK